MSEEDTRLPCAGCWLLVAVRYLTKHVIVYGTKVEKQRTTTYYFCQKCERKFGSLY